MGQRLMSGIEERQALERHLILLEEKNGRLTTALTIARTGLIHLQEEPADVPRPPQTLATLMRALPASRQIEVVTDGRRIYVAVTPKLDVTNLSYGQWMRLDDTMTVVAADNFLRSGQVVSVLELAGPDHVLMATEGGAESLLELADPLRYGNLHPGDSLVVDVHLGIALERTVRGDIEQLFAPEVSDVAYEGIDGLDDQIVQMCDSIEIPFNHPELYRQFGLCPPKGILSHGSPGSDKALIAKAVANSLSKHGSASTLFLSIKGPELLNKFVGEVEYQIRAIFVRARTLAAGDTPVVTFFGEMETLFHTRGTGVSSDVETMIVPQLLAETNGVEPLDSVVIIGAPNRADVIDPAVLHPGRLNVCVCVDRPDRAGTLDILSKYLTPRVSTHASETERFGGINEAVAGIGERGVDALYARNEATAFFPATLMSGNHKRIYLSDLVSGALITGIVGRAEKCAIRDTLMGASSGLSMDHLLHGVREEVSESLELATISSSKDWTRTSGLAPGIVNVKLIGTVK